jgi:hypothetical protein
MLKQYIKTEKYKTKVSSINKKDMKIKKLKSNNNNKIIC